MMTSQDIQRSSLSSRSRWISWRHILRETAEFVHSWKLLEQTAELLSLQCDAASVTWSGDKQFRGKSRCSNMLVLQNKRHKVNIVSGGTVLSLQLDHDRIISNGSHRNQTLLVLCICKSSLSQNCVGVYVNQS